jgi:hypothetical protein
MPPFVGVGARQDNATFRQPRGKVTASSRARLSPESVKAGARNRTDPDMKLTLRLDPNRLRRWHVRLVERLARRPDTHVGVEWNAGAQPLPRAVELLFTLERRVYGLPPGDEMAAAPEDFARCAASAETPDLVLDFTDSAPSAGTRTWRITFDGAADETAALASLTNKRTPIVQITDAATGAMVVVGHPGTESAGVFTLAWRDVMARTATLIMAALDGAAARTDAVEQRPGTLATGALAQFAAESLARKGARWLYHLCYNAPHWRVGWRFVDGPDVIDLRAHPPGGWRELPDDRSRFYADPFPIEHDGRTFLFVEDFAHAAGYGVISVVEFDANGPVGPPRPVLDTGSHLSYPFVFGHESQVWMVPESGAAGTIDLYRAEAFPHRWIKDATLVPGVVASDATLFEHDGRWWMFATVRDEGGAYSDALHIWSAPGLRGPWQPHRRNPVLIDIATARPAGRVVRRGDKLFRPFQDCDAGYGAALGLAEITRLDDEGFSQRVETVLRPGPLWPGSRLHTLNRAGRLECIDGSATARRF